MPVTAEQMAPRPCRLCHSKFSPKRPQDCKSQFCCRDHQAMFWKKAMKAGSEIVGDGGVVISPINGPGSLPDLSAPVDASPGVLEAPGPDIPDAVYGKKIPAKLCALPGCDQPPAASGRFCCVACKDEYWHMAAQLGDQMLKKISCGSQAKRVFDLLKARAGKWTSRPHEPVYRDAVTKLRKRGHVIQCRRVGGNLGKPEYQYRLVEKPLLVEQAR